MSTLTPEKLRTGLDFYVASQDLMILESPRISLADVVLCEFPAQRDPAVSGWFAGNIWAALVHGLFTAIAFDVGSPPCKDALRSANQEKLMPLSRFGLNAMVDLSQNCGLSDGNVQWQGSLIPLEIGYCSAQTQWMHLYDSMGVCRWPYGVPYVVLILANRHHSQWSDFWKTQA